MDVEVEKQELKVMGRAFSATIFVLWGVFPIHVLGWLVSAVARHPDVEKQLINEPAYKVILFWQGGVNMLPPVMLLILFLLALFGLSYVFRKLGYSHPEDGMVKGREFFRSILIPSFLSASAFAAGVLSGGTQKDVVSSSVVLLCFGFLAGVFRYFTDTTQDV